MTPCSENGNAGRFATNWAEGVLYWAQRARKLLRNASGGLMRRLLTLLLTMPFAIAMAQEPNAELAAKSPAPEVTSSGQIILPAGTQIPLVLKQAISTKNAKAGDAVYAETNFPITMNDKVIIPAGTYVQGGSAEVKRAGRVKGKAEILMHFTTLVFPT